MTMTQRKDNVWTRFMDMNSGGGRKEKWEYIFIEAPRPEAEVVFYNRFGHNPNRVSCTCCGEDYSVDDGPLDQVTAFDRNCRFVRVEGEEGGGHYIEESDPDRPWAGPHIPLEAYLLDPGVHVIRAEDILPSERQGTVPDEGYVWV